MLVIIDFGGQTTHLIKRRLKEIGVQSSIIIPEEALQFIKEKNPKGIILSGGPSSVYEDGAPTVPADLFRQNIPTLGICYGLQLMAQLLPGGEVIGGRKEYGPAQITIKNTHGKLTKDLPDTFTVWMSHGDEVKKMPEAFEIVGLTESVPYTFVENDGQKLYGVQFHPEVEHTEFGRIILENFASICGIKPNPQEIDVEAIEKDIKEQAGDGYVIGAVSGGVDSTVAGALAAKALGDHFVPVYVENGLMRVGTAEHVEKFFKTLNVKPIVVECESEMLERLKGKTDPEEKRITIGNFYIEIFEREFEKLQKEGKNVTHLLQGTIYSDVIESQGTRHASKIKSHHNVGGLPEKMKLQLLEPMRYFFKDEVRAIGKKLGLSSEFVHKQPFPGPGYAVRIRGEVTKERLEREKIADKIVLEELENADILKKVFISFPVMTGADSTAVKGDGRFFGEVVALRIVESQDVMTAKWAKVSYEVLQKISSRIVNEVPGISRVVYDITTKPPATMEWE